MRAPTRRRGRILVLAVPLASLLLEDCAAAYQPRGLTRGVSDTRIDPSAGRVSSPQDPFMPRDRVHGERANPETAAVVRPKAERREGLGRLQAQATPGGASPPAPTSTPQRSEPWFRGASGPVEWEIVAIEQNRSADGTMIRWDFELVLRERAGTGIAFHTLVSDSEGPSTRTSADRLPFARRLDPRGEIRYTAFYWIKLATERTPGFGVIPGGREGVRLLRRFEGRDDDGKTVRVDVRFSLDPAVGDRPRLVASTSPLPASRALRADELPLLAGSWSGHLTDERGITFAFRLAVRPDGRFDAAAGTTVIQRFRGTLATSGSGDLQYTTGPQSGRVSVHDDGSDRVLAASVTPRVGAPASAVPYSFRVRFISSGTSAPSAALATPAVTPPAPVTDEVLTNESILVMVKAGLDATVIVAKIEATAARFDTRTQALVALKEAGVPDRVLAAMVAKR